MKYNINVNKNKIKMKEDKNKEKKEKNFIKFDYKSSALNLSDGKVHDSILVVGNFYGFFGETDENGYMNLLSSFSKETLDTIDWMFIQNKDAKHVFMGVKSYIGDYLHNLRKTVKNLFGINIKDENWIEYLVEDDSKMINILNKVKEEMPKFDYIIQNPPYNKNLHIQFFNKGLDILSDNGKMVIIEPATWLINIRKDGNVKSIYKDFKKSIQNKISKVIVDNFNHELNTRINNSFSITYIDNSKNDDKFESIIFGNKKILNDIMFINYIEDYNNIWNIINKCLEKCDNIGKHVFDLEKKVDIRNNKKNSFIRICNIVAHYLSLVDEGHKESDNSYDNKNNLITYTNLLSNGEVSSNPLKKLNSVKKETDKYANCIVGTYQELTNWKHFCENNTLPLFINICMTIDQNNNSLKYVPWLVDKQYTDEEIYKMFNFTQQEINLIEKTVKKFKRNTPWTQRMIYGPSKVSDQEVQEFCDKLDKEYPTD